MPEQNSQTSYPPNGHPPPLLPRSPKIEQSSKPQSNHGLKSLFTRSPKPKPSTLSTSSSKGNLLNSNLIDAGPIQGQTNDARSPIRNGPITQNGHKSPTSPRIVSDSQTHEMNFLVPPEGQNYGGNMNRSFDQQSERVRICSAFDQLRPIVSDHNARNFKEMFGKGEKFDLTGSKGVMERMSKRDFYLMKDCKYRKNAKLYWSFL